jgi:hypothetical protein
MGRRGPRSRARSSHKRHCRCGVSGIERERERERDIEREVVERRQEKGLEGRQVMWLRGVERERGGGRESCAATRAGWVGDGVDLSVWALDTSCQHNPGMSYRYKSTQMVNLLFPRFPLPPSPFPWLFRSASKLLLTRRKNLPPRPLARSTLLGIVSGPPTAWLLIKSAEALWQQRPIAGRVGEHSDAGSGYPCCALRCFALLCFAISSHLPCPLSPSYCAGLRRSK